MRGPSDVEKLEQQALVERNLARMAGSKAIAVIHTRLAKAYAARAKTTADEESSQAEANELGTRECPKFRKC